MIPTVKPILNTREKKKIKIYMQSILQNNALTEFSVLFKHLEDFKIFDYRVF